MSSAVSPSPVLRSLKLLAGGGINSVSATIVLLFLAGNADGTVMKSLCGQAGCSASNMTGIIDRLADQGYVERRFLRHDRRTVSVRITAKGLELLQRAGLA